MNWAKMSIADREVVVTNDVMSGATDYATFAAAYGTTKSAVKSMAYRLRRRGRVEPAPLVKKGNILPFVAAIPRTGNVALTDVSEGQCRYPLWETIAGPFNFCGARVAHEKTRYCQKHHAACHVIERKR